MIKSKILPHKELLIRIASAAVLVPVVLWMISFGSWVFFALLCSGIILLSLEWSVMVAPSVSKRVATTIAITDIAALLATFLGHPIVSICILGLGALISGLYAMRLKTAWIDVAYGTLYIGFPALVLIWLRESDRGQYWVFFAFVITWAADSGAYIGGKIIGGPKLWPKYSPNKTWAGFVFGLVSGIFAASILSDITRLFKYDISASIVGLSVALATMMGDLWESMLKRRYGVKDSGQLIPGHGGLLDRVDGLMFAIVCVGGIKLLVLLGTVIL